VAGRCLMADVIIADFVDAVAGRCLMADVIMADFVDAEWLEDV